MISIIIPWKNRPELGQTLIDNLPAFAHMPELELLVVNMGGDQQQLLTLLDTEHCQHLTIKVVHILTTFFNKSFALNWGIHHAAHDTIFVLDADVVLSHTALNELYHQVSDTHFANLESVAESLPQNSSNFYQQCQTRTVLTLPIGTQQPIEVLVNQSSLSNDLRAAPGLLMAKKQHLLAIEGFDSKMTYWGWEDLDLVVRLKAKLNLTQTLTGNATHLTHDDSTRNLGNLNRTQSDHKNFTYCLEKYASAQFLGSLYKDTCNQFEQYVSVHQHR
ncbi:glycosyltransferase family 2 protein [Pseudoalteromonas sp. SMS1]|uniref:glycosyltransferase n=1 Tax=Pseudoalteromonas sp. SMS1 TaxID=2908894 RepID=UPI001F2247AD|nr:glycosyltransferase family 2 protein [Pseudoalteromonas sp. SMS1]MCF2856400.1 glycosyltransferase family 2 protein [Pseudoalteromonas sp. SMS1]